MLIHSFLVLLGLLALSAFFSASETAFLSISKAKAHDWAKEGGRIAGLIQRMKDDPHRLFTTLRIGNHAVNIAASCLATLLVLQRVPDHVLSIATGVMTLVILVFGEIVPKSLAVRHHFLIGRLAILPVYWLSRLLYPVMLLLDFIPRVAERIQGMPKVTEAELLTMVEAVEEDGQIKEREKELIHNIFEFDDTRVSEIMTPRADMFVVEIHSRLDLPEIFKSGFTRIPIIDGDMDHIVGILNIKDLLLHPSSDSQPIDLRKIMREPYFVPEHKKLDKLLQGFKRRKQHMAIVVDEHGGVAGLITLEDALEEIVGEIIDETDIIEPTIVDVAPGEWRVMGKTEIGEVNEKLQMNIPDTGTYDTFSGYVLNQTGRIPREEEEIPIGEFTVVVKARQGNRIIEYRVRKRPDPHPHPFGA
jgi:CBS domain containing-hemolysin-like protein